MLTTTHVIALAGFMASAALESPSWHADYGSAQRLGRERYKPLAVFIGSGKAGWNQVSREGRLGNDVKQLLAKNYICVYVDTDLKAGRRLASEFGVPEGLGLVISDHTGKYQAFYHQGELPSEQLLHYLSRYADSKRVVRATETNPPERVSYYPPEDHQQGIESYYSPIRYSPVFSGRGGRSC